jgi:hypothetical protein
MVEPAPAVTDPALIPPFDLAPVAAVPAAAWPQERQRLLELFRHHVYGRAPSTGWTLAARIHREDAQAYGGLAVRSEILATLATPRGERSFRILVHRPAHSAGPVPLLLELNFAGNHATVPDDWPTLTNAWVPAREDAGSPAGAARDCDRGMLARRLPVAETFAAGFAVATVYAGELEPDRPDGWRDGIRALFPDPDPATAPDDAWGTLAVWSFGLSRTLDAVLATLPMLDAGRLGVIGHSRMGKAALWAGAQDERFALTVSNDSGCTGAAIARRRFGERQAIMNRSFPHWCARTYRTFDEREADLPIDQHHLLALIAPRLLHVGSAADDLWADPDGELLACVHAAPAWDLLGVPGFSPVPDPLPLAGWFGRRVTYHRRPGPHDILAVDWHRVVAAARANGW